MKIQTSEGAGFSSLWRVGEILTEWECWIFDSSSAPRRRPMGFFCHLGCSDFVYTIPFGTLDTSLRPRGGVWGVFGLQTLVGRHRDSNPGPACESGVLAITLRGRPWPMGLFSHIFWVFVAVPLLSILFRHCAIFVDPLLSRSGCLPSLFLLFTTFDLPLNAIGRGGGLWLA